MGSDDTKKGSGLKHFKDSSKKSKSDKDSDKNRLRYPIGSSFTLRPNMLRDFKSPSKNSDVNSSSKKHQSSSASSKMPTSQSSIGAISALANPSALASSNHSSTVSNAKDSFFAEKPSGYFSLRRPFSNSFKSSKNSQSYKSDSSSNSSEGSSKSAPEKADLFQNYSDSSSSSLHYSPVRRSRPGDMSLLRTMKSMSVVEDSSSAADDSKGILQGGVLGGVFAGIRDSMSNSLPPEEPLTIDLSNPNGSNGQSNNISHCIGNSINNVTQATSKINSNGHKSLFLTINGSSNSTSDTMKKSDSSKSDLARMVRSETMSSCSSEASSPSTSSSMSHFTSEHASAALKAMNSLRNNKQLCDVELIVSSQSVFAHKVVLAAASPYFTAMFLNDVKERTASEVEMQGVDATALKLLVDYVYTGEISITEDNVQVLLPASNLLQLTSVRDASCKFLMRQLHPSNCLGIRTFADAHSCRELHTKSHKYAMQNFHEVCDTEEFLMLSREKVLELVSSSELNTDCEERVFSAVIGWIKHDLNERAKYVSELLSHVRLPLLSRDFLTSHVDNEPLMHGDSQCQTLQLEALKYHLLPEQRSSFTSQRTKERKPQGYKPYLFAVGGGSLFALHSEVECYNPRTERWMPVASMNHRRSRTAATSTGRFLYVMGGYDGVGDLNYCERYNPSVNRWEDITSMGTKRSCHGIGVLNGLIYCVGGYDGASCLNSVERYDPLTGIWSSCPALSCKRRHTKVAVVDQCLYAIAGFDTINYQCSVERLDPREGKWEAMPALVSRRSSLGAVGVEGVGIYCSGGTDGTVCLSSVEKFNTRRSAWEPVASMQNRRSTHELVTFDGFVYALGGNDGSTSLNSIERYDSKTNKWQLMPPMQARRSSVAVSVVDCYNFEKVLVGKKQ